MIKTHLSKSSTSSDCYCLTKEVLAHTTLLLVGEGRWSPKAQVDKL